jgi:hypothetical protein
MHRVQLLLQMPRQHKTQLHRCNMRLQPCSRSDGWAVQHIWRLLGTYADSCQQVRPMA